MSKSNFFNTSIGRKFVMGITGLFLTVFLLVHVTVNSFIFIDPTGELFNAGATFMGTNPFIRATEVILFLGLIWHAVQALTLTRINQAARPVGYNATEGSKASSKWYSRSMGLLGTLLLMFLIIHLWHFWVKARLGLNGGMEEEHNMFATMKVVFSQLWVVILYVLCMVSLAYHLMHGVQSAFQSLGWNHYKYTPAIKSIGTWIAIIVPALFAAMPLYVYFVINQ
jgi:succinate dehydrogenase / fumarate reductase cytochrome b subunit